MLGNRRTIPLWQRRRRRLLSLLALERALGPGHATGETSSEQAILNGKSAQRMTEAAKHRTGFSKAD